MTERKPSNASIPKYIKAEVLNKIRAEIEELDGKYVIGDYATYGEHSPKYVQLMEVLQIIDRYEEEYKRFQELEEDLSSILKKSHELPKGCHLFVVESEE